MPRLDPKKIPPSTGPRRRTLAEQAERDRLATWPRCSSCGERMHPTLARAGTHPLCSELPPATWDRMAGWAA